MSKVIIVSIMFCLLVIGLGGVANANNAVVWYQAPGKAYPDEYNSTYVNVLGPVGKSSHDNSYKDNWMLLNVTVDSVSFQSTKEQVSVMITAIAYSNASLTLAGGNRNET